MVNFIEAHVFTISIFCFSFKFAEIKFGKCSSKIMVSIPYVHLKSLGFLLIDNKLVYALKPYFLF